MFLRACRRIFQNHTFVSTRRETSVTGGATLQQRRYIRMYLNGNVTKQSLSWFWIYIYGFKIVVFKINKELKQSDWKFGIINWLPTIKTDITANRCLHQVDCALIKHLSSFLLSCRILWEIESRTIELLKHLIRENHVTHYLPTVTSRATFKSMMESAVGQHKHIIVKANSTLELPESPSRYILFYFQ